MECPTYGKHAHACSRANHIEEGHEVCGKGVCGKGADGGSPRASTVAHAAPHGELESMNPPVMAIISATARSADVIRPSVDAEDRADMAAPCNTTCRIERGSESGQQADSFGIVWCDRKSRIMAVCPVVRKSSFSRNAGIQRQHERVRFGVIETAPSLGCESQWPSPIAAHMTARATAVPQQLNPASPQARRDSPLTSCCA